MAKVQGKTAAAGGKKGAAKASKNVAARLKSAVAKAKKKVVAKAKPAPKPKKPAKAAKPIPKPTAKPAARKPSKPVAAPKSMPKAKVAAKTAMKPSPKPAPKPSPKPAPPKPAAKVASAPKGAPPKAATAKPAVSAPPKAAPAAKPAAPSTEKRARRPRTRVTSNGTPMANWFAQGEKPRPSSFIPAPPRAESPSLIAAPPASSDRLIRPEDVTDLAVRTVPVRVDIEQSGGRAYIAINPEEATLRVGEGIEWDFRYIGGTDVTVDEIVIEFEKPSPFSQAVFKSRKPGTARPHRQLSGAAQKPAAGKRVKYTIKAMTPFKTALAVAAPYVTVTE